MFPHALSNESIKTQLIDHVELDASDRKIWYISDIHLDVKIGEKFDVATIDEIRLYIEECVQKMAESAKGIGDDDYLLIGGDVSYCFDCSKIFYSELKKQWPNSNIIAVLGNHELFDANINGQECKDNVLENTVSKYKHMFKEVKITLLQNSLMICGETTKVLSEKTILEKSAKELREIALKSDLIVFGGIGFSAYNKKYNAGTIGLYKNAVPTFECDLKYTQQTENVYNKVCEAFSKDKIIVLSHMELSDWSKRKPVSNWIYVHGHTHQNKYQFGEYTVYADNQIGYKNSNLSLKCFRTISGYDIFRYYDDGIYTITIEQYADFYYGKAWESPKTDKIGKQINEGKKQLVMLKKHDVYMFLLKSTRTEELQLLEGGIAKNSKNDINYYYTNMERYASAVKLALKDYNAALKDLSNFIKRFGGSGKIHGSIVDIDTYNHAYIDEHGFINPYFSISKSAEDIQHYNTFEELLEKHLPSLYDNYQKIVATQGKPVAVAREFSELSECIEYNKFYEMSDKIKTLQYITDYNIIRDWKDEILRHAIVERDKLST